VNAHAYCTYFDYAYASRGRILIETLREQGDDGDIFVLALDAGTTKLVSSWTDLGVIPVSLEELESHYPRLLKARSNRSRMEYLFTLTPWLTQWTLEQVPPDSWATYLDADMAFFSTPEILYGAAANGSIMVVEHRFTWEQAWRRKYGRFNVAWVGFRNDARGRACLTWWAESCREWCYDEVSEGRFADQGYLDHFPEFAGVVIIDHPGVDVAPWNLRRHRLTTDESGSVLADAKPLVFFHFHGLCRVKSRYYFKHLPYMARTTSTLREYVYRPYCVRLNAAEERLGSPETQVLDRRPTLAASLRSGRARTLRWLGERRGDYLDISQH
jgi:hypothetical protein